MMNVKYLNHLGFSYVEVLITTLLIAILLTPAIESMIPGIKSAAIHETQTQYHYKLSGKMEYVLSRPFDELQIEATADSTTPSNFSEITNSELDQYVYITNYDIDNLDGDGDVFTGGEENLLWIKTSNYDGSIIFETLLTRP